jgi:hypothetical protein
MKMWLRVFGVELFEFGVEDDPDNGRDPGDSTSELRIETPRLGFTRYDVVPGEDSHRPFPRR